MKRVGEGQFELPIAAAEAINLFTPEGERAWAPGWSPEYPAGEASESTGTVFTTDDRDWELRHADLSKLFNQTRAIAVDMESATIAANGYRFRVPYGTLLCVSDKPLHGDIKLPGMANAFYRQRVSQHIKIGIEAVCQLRDAGVETLHSRKLRSFDEPAFR